MSAAEAKQILDVDKNATLEQVRKVRMQTTPCISRRGTLGHGEGPRWGAQLEYDYISSGQGNFIGTVLQQQFAGTCARRALTLQWKLSGYGSRTYLQKKKAFGSIHVPNQFGIPFIHIEAGYGTSSNLT